MTTTAGTRTNPAQSPGGPARPDQRRRPAGPPRRPPRARPPVREPGPRPVVLVGIGVAGWIALLGLALIVCVVLVAWLTAAHHNDALAPAIATAVAAWLLAQHCSLTLPGGHLSVVPLLLTFVLGALLVRGGRQAARLTEAVSRGKVVAVTFAVAVPYAVAGALLTRVVDHAGVSASPVRGAAGTFALAVLCVGYGALRESQLLVALFAALPGWSRLLLRSGLVGFAVVVAVAAVGIVLALIGHGSRVVALNNSLHPGLPGSALLAVVSAAYLPNAIAWTASLAAGPGFAVGTGTSVSLAGVHLGAVPALPLLAPLPQSGHAPAVAWLLVSGLVAGGATIGWLVARRPTEVTVRSVDDGVWWLRLRLPDAGLALAAGACTGALLGVLGWLSGGSIGPGRMSDAGPAGLYVGLAAAAEVGALAALTVAALAWRASAMPAVIDVAAPAAEPEQLAFDTPEVAVVTAVEADEPEADSA
jgi:hypothetical protein